MMMSLVLSCLLAGVGIVNVGGGTDGIDSAVVANQVYFVYGVIVDQSAKDPTEPVLVMVSKMSMPQARQKAELYGQIRQELLRIRAKYPEPDVDDPQISQAWFETIAVAKEVRLNALYDRYYALKGQDQAFSFPPGIICEGDILYDLPSQAEPADKGRQ